MEQKNNGTASFLRYMNPEVHFISAVIHSFTGLSLQLNFGNG